MSDEIINSSEEEDDVGRFVYMEEKEAELSSDSSDVLEEDGSSSPYARRRPYSVELRRNRVSRQESYRSSGSSVVELRRGRLSRQESNRSSGSSLIASLQNYTSIIFTRQTSKNVSETDF